MNLAIIIVGFNSKKYLSDCLGALRKADKADKTRVFFVDNNSSDESVLFIQENFPEVIVIESKKNLGFAGGNNLGIEEAIKTGADHILLLNPDTIIDQNCLKVLESKADTQTILQPLILLHLDGKMTDLVNTSGNHLNFLGFSYCDDYKKHSSQIIEKEITSASGAAMLIPAEIINRIGVFDENFFMYHEDLDLCWRARLNEFNIRVIPEAKVWHKYSFSKNKSKMFFVERNRLLFLYKNFSLIYLILISPIFIINEILISLYALLTGWGVKKIQATFSAIKLTRKLKKERKRNYLKIQKTQHELIRFIKSEIAFSEIGSSAIFWPYNALLWFYWRLIRIFI